MSEHTSEGDKKHVRVYLTIGAALILGTIITVLASNVRLGIILGIAVAIAIATIKGSLVAGYFMHLLNERKMIYQLLALTVVFIVAMIALLVFSFGDQQGKHTGIFNVPAQHAQPHSAEHK